MEKVIECPYCEGKANLRVQEKEFVFKKECLISHEYFYQCDLCAEEFTTNEVDEFTILQISNQYRSKHAIPFPQQLIDLKLKYGLSSAKMSEVLGLGANGYSNYEKGEVPTLAIANLLSNASDPAVFKNMFIKVKDSFSDNAYREALKKIEHLINNKEEENYIRLNYYEEPNSFTGFRALNKERISNLVLAFILRCKEDFNDRLKLNKLLFYTDFLSYKKRGYSITGLTYRAIQYGPVPSYYDNMYTILENDGVVMSTWKKEEDGSGKEIFTAEKDFDSTVFEAHDIEIIDLVIDKFKDTSSWDLVELSHGEQSWKDLITSKDIIDYQKYAYCLEAI
ncbi:hypothetical protein GCM10022386_01710 [Flavobacterium cheonhonense]|uniref:HTH cro/C1-type domain-containing protein n=1 Tax=Flavobacterium cheonhonense TaxID=706185 RepID=A0ABP7T877_9FLAO|nr:type II toxin-antitoxin system antitoxin SocA domain-containing protein [Flavobacterium cheonhonense]